MRQRVRQQDLCEEKQQQQQQPAGWAAQPWVPAVQPQPVRGEREAGEKQEDEGVGGESGRRTGGAAGGEGESRRPHSLFLVLFFARLTVKSSSSACELAGAAERGIRLICWPAAALRRAECAAREETHPGTR